MTIADNLHSGEADPLAQEVATGAGKSETTNRYDDATSPADSNAIAVDKQELSAPVAPGYFWRSNSGYIKDGILTYFVSISDELTHYVNANRLATECFKCYVINHNFKITEAVAKSERNEARAITEYTYRAGVL